jgi:hypothetical protein
MKAVHSFQTVVTTYNTSWRDNQEGHKEIFTDVMTPTNFKVLEACVLVNERVPEDRKL